MNTNTNFKGGTMNGDRSNIGEIFRINHDMNNYLRFLSINSGNRL